MYLKRLLWALAAPLFFVSCSEKETPDTEPDVKIDFAVTSVSVPAGTSSELALTVDPSEKGSFVSVSIADEEVASITGTRVDGDNVYVALQSNSLGTTTLVAVLEDKIAECAVTVAPIAVESIILDKTSIDINMYDTYTLKAEVKPENATNPIIDWTSSDDRIATVSRGVVTGIREGKATITAAFGGVETKCEVNVHMVHAESLTLDVTSKEIAEGETFIVTATVLPKNVTSKTMTWSVSKTSVASIEVIDVDIKDNIVAARVTGLEPGEAVLSVECSGLIAECAVVVKAPVIPVAPPKVGDYYYSDGTWSDGGLLSINDDGTDPVWKDVKPAPEAGKTVIGIVFQTDAKRISATEKAAGHTNGLVMAVRTAHGEKSMFTRYSFDSDFEKIPNKKLGTSWYGDIEGYNWTEEIKKAYPGDKISQCPAFDFTTRDFQPSAPAGTSGWYVPSIGQVWDMMANLGGGEVAAQIKEARTYTADISYYWRDHGRMNLTYDPIEKLNSCMSQIPDSEKENFTHSNKRGESNLCEILSSSLYDNADGNVCVFWLYDDGQIEFEIDWSDNTYVCRPILSF